MLFSLRNTAGAASGLAQVAARGGYVIVMDRGGIMKTTLLHRLPMIPRLTAAAGEAEGLAHDYVGWQLLEVDEST